jgi:protein TonB
MWRILGITCAVGLHAGFLLFGGLLFPQEDEDHGTLQEVELLSEDESAEDEEEKKPEEKAAEDSEELETEPEEPPAEEDLVRTLEPTSANEGPALDAASLSAIEAALNGVQGSSDFASSVDFTSEGRIGSTGTLAKNESEFMSQFSLDEIDQKPRAVYQASPLFPNNMRGKKVEGLVSVIFIVDASGRVQKLRAEESTHPAFTQPALEAVKQWRFEPAVRSGERVACPMRVSIRFPQG